MNTIIIGASGKIGRFFSLKKRKNQVLTYYRNKIKHGIRFDLKHDNISPIIKKHKISKAVIMSAYSDPDFCKRNKKISHKLNVTQTKKLINKLIRNKLYFIFFGV